MGALLSLLTAIYEPFTPVQQNIPQTDLPEILSEGLHTVISEARSRSEESESDGANVDNLITDDIVIAWLSYWEKHGVELTVKKWTQNYKDYLNEDFDVTKWVSEAVSQSQYTEANTNKNCDRQTGANNQDSGDSSYDNSAEALWQAEWQKHCDLVHQEEYSIFVQHYKEAEMNQMPEEIKKNPKLKKYWFQRYLLFSKYDHGIQLDEESWFSVTPEKIAAHIAKKCRGRIGGTVLDGFCGVGGNAIQFAKFFDKVIAIDLDPVKVEYAENNAIIYGVRDKIEFLVGDFMALAPQLAADIVFLSPPWGGMNINYTQTTTFNLKKMQPLSGPAIFQVAKAVSPNIVFYVPRNVNRDQLSALAGPGNCVEIEENKFKGRVKAVSAYYGDLIKPKLRLVSGTQTNASL